MKTRFRTLFACCAAGALAVSLAACGPDDGNASTSQFMAGSTAVDPGWSMMDLAGVDPAFLGEGDTDLGSLPQALPMAASYDGGSYGYAPSYDYAPDDGGSYYAPLDDSYYYDDGYYDDGYYEDGYYDGGYYDAGYYDDGYDEGFYNLGDDGSDYALLALAVSLATMLGDSPPDYGYYYDDVSPWAWRTGDGYYRYAEPIHGGYRYYYYEPDSYRPFLVSDPYYSYGYRDDRLVAIYDRGGRRIDARRADLQLRAAKAYYARADRLYEAAQRDHYGVPAPLWARQREVIARDRDSWFRDQATRPAWKRWETRNQPKLYRQWSSEALVRRDAERRFDGWQRADYRTPAPTFYTPEVRRERVREIAVLRRERADDITERRRDFAEQRAAQKRETRELAERAQEARRERVSELAERREVPAARGIAISDIRERGAGRPSAADRIAERREDRADRRADRAERPSAAQRVERERPTASARQEARQQTRRAERPAPQPRAQQVKREQPQAAVKRAQPAERVRAERQQPQARREAPARRAEQQAARQARETRRSAPEPRQRAERAQAASQPRADRPQAAQQRAEARQQERQNRVQARQERQQAASQPRAERAQPRQQARQEAAPRQRPERQQARSEPAQRQQQAEARQQARQERQEARTAQREERRQRPS